MPLGNPLSVPLGVFVPVSRVAVTVQADTYTYIHTGSGDGCVLDGLTDEDASELTGRGCSDERIVGGRAACGVAMGDGRAGG